ncbi:MAG: hypothetical protein ACOCRK_02735 [bacterium]
MNNNRTTSSFEIAGLQEVDEALSTLSPRLAANILLNTNKEIIRKEVRPKLRGLPYNAKPRITRNRRRRTAALIGYGEPFYIRFVDRGTTDRFLNKNNSYRGKIRANNFITNILKQSDQKVIETAKKSYNDIIIKHLNRKIKNVNKKILQL